jgi:hypothetical protein
MSRRVDSRDVLDPNAVTRVELEAEVIGRYRPTGPNTWDEWELTSEDDGERITVEPGAQIQLEPVGADPEIRFRHRQRRAVLRLRWLPTDDDRTQLATGQWGVKESEQATILEKMFGLGPKDDPRDDMLEYFVTTKAGPHSSDRGTGMAVMLVKKLRGEG